MISTSVDFIRKVLINQMELDEDRVNIYNQKFVIPPIDGIFIVVSYKSSKIISSRNYTRVNLSGLLEEVQDLNTQEMLSIMIFSRNREAIDRKEEAVMALYSIFSQQLQEKYSLRIFRMAPIQDLSELEGSAQLYRFDIPIVMFSWYEKVQSADFYDTYDVEVRVNDGQPDMLVDFQQPTT